MKTFKQYITEKQSDTIVITFGRFQGLHIGHENLINTVIEEARKRNADYMIFPSTTQDSKKNPIPFDEKVELMKEVFPGINVNENPDLNQIFKILPYLAKGEGYNEVILVAGEDRIESWKGKLGKYLRGDGPLQNLDFVSTEERLFSGTQMRELVHNNEFDKFYNAMPDGTDKSTARKVFTTMKQNLEA